MRVWKCSALHERLFRSSVSSTLSSTPFGSVSRKKKTDCFVSCTVYFWQSYHLTLKKTTIRLGVHQGIILIIVWEELIVRCNRCL